MSMHGPPNSNRTNMAKTEKASLAKYSQYYKRFRVRFRVRFTCVLACVFTRFCDHCGAFESAFSRAALCVFVGILRSVFVKKNSANLNMSQAFSNAFSSAFSNAFSPM
jgi:hypothetical protein